MQSWPQVMKGVDVMNFKLPGYVRKVMSVLEQEGFEAYVVGGAVRDLLLGRLPDDYDVVTNARPDEIKLLAQKHQLSLVSNLGQNFGVVMLLVDKNVVEVASYRNETYGSDAHKPEEVWYCDTLEEDLGRRDFTINAMAVNLAGTLVDKYGGQEDLRNKLLRTVGNADKRFEEDALRMFRACRFVAQLNFAYDEKIGKAIEHSLERVQGLSLERIQIELNKLLVGEAASRGMELLVSSGLAAQSCRYREQGQTYGIALLPELEPLRGLKQNPEYHQYDVWEHTLVALSHSDRSLDVSWGILLHDIAKGMEGIRGTNDKGQPTDHGHEARGAGIAENILSRMRFPKELVARVGWLVRNHMKFGANSDAPDNVTWRWLRKCARSGEFRENKVMAEAFKQLTALCIADTAATTATKQELISAQMYGNRLVTMAYHMPVHTSDLKLSGEDLFQEGLRPEQLGKVLPLLLQRVQDGAIRNTYEALLQAAVAWRERQNNL